MTEVFDLVKSKRAVRKFTDEPLPEHIVQEIVQAGRLSGSAKNTQPWHFVIVRDKPTLKALSTCGGFAGHLEGAAMAIALVTEDPFARLTVPFDLGRTTQNMMLTAWSHGVGSVMATIYQSAKAGEILNVPEGYAVPWCISFGYPANPARSPRKGMRKTTEDIIHWEQW